MHDGNEAITILLRAIYMGNFLFVQPTQSFSTRGEQKKVLYQGSPAQAKCWKLQIDFRSINIGWVGRGRRGKWKVGSGMAGQAIIRIKKVLLNSCNKNSLEEQTDLSALKSV